MIPREKMTSLHTHTHSCQTHTHTQTHPPTHTYTHPQSHTLSNTQNHFTQHTHKELELTFFIEFFAKSDEEKMLSLVFFLQI